MSGRGRRNDKCIEHAVVFLLRCQGASVPEAIHAAKFTLEGRLEMAKQMVVSCAYAKAICGNMKLQRRWKASRCCSRLCLPSSFTIIHCRYHCCMLPSLSLSLLSLFVVVFVVVVIVLVAIVIDNHDGNGNGDSAISTTVAFS